MAAFLSSAAMRLGQQTILGNILVLNLCIYIIVCATAGWALNKAIHHEIITENATTLVFIILALIAGVVGAASCLSGLHHLYFCTENGFMLFSALTALGLTLLAMCLACKEINSQGRNSRVKVVESFVIVLSLSQLLYIHVLGIN